MARRILVVDDEPAIRTVLAAYLEADGFAVVHADTGAEALRRALDTSDPVDLVLLDVGLPDLNGLEVLTTIRARSEVSVILVTARAEEVDKLVGLNVGADDYVTKPFRPAGGGRPGEHRAAPRPPGAGGRHPRPTPCSGSPG